MSPGAGLPGCSPGAASRCFIHEPAREPGAAAGCRGGGRVAGLTALFMSPVAAGGRFCWACMSPGGLSALFTSPGGRVGRGSRVYSRGGCPGRPHAARARACIYSRARTCRGVLGCSAGGGSFTSPFMSPGARGWDCWAHTYVHEPGAAAAFWPEAFPTCGLCAEPAEWRGKSRIKREGVF